MGSGGNDWQGGGAVVMDTSVRGVGSGFQAARRRAAAAIERAEMPHDLVEAFSDTHNLGNELKVGVLLKLAAAATATATATAVAVARVVVVGWAWPRLCMCGEGGNSGA